MTPKRPEPKTDSKPAPRVIDITQPGGVPATPTARPVIVGHQPAAADPMVVPVSGADSGQAAVDSPKPASAKIVIKPLVPEPDAVAIASSVDGMPVPPKRTTAVADKDADSDGVVDGPVPAFVGPLTAAAGPAAHKTSPDTFGTAASQQAVAEQTPEKAPESNPESPGTGTVAKDDPPSVGTGRDETTDLPGMAKIDVDKQAADMEAEAKAQDELDSLVDDKIYFLPINAASQRRSRNVFIFGTVLIVILLLAWLNIALDAGFVTIPRIKPLTNLFGLVV